MTIASHNGEAGRVHEIIAGAKALAREYYELTGRPLGITGEVAEVTAVHALGLEIAPVRQSGYDAIRRRDDGTVQRLQIKGRCYQKGMTSGQRVGGIKLEKEWDAVLLVLLDKNLELMEIYEAQRGAISEALLRPGSVSRNERGALAVAQFKNIGLRVWPETANTVGMRKPTAEPALTQPPLRVTADTWADDVAMRRVECPACAQFVFDTWPFGWDAHAAHACRALAGSDPAARKAEFKRRFAHLFRGNEVASRGSSQRDAMRRVWEECRPDTDRAVREYADAERRGEVRRGSNKYAVSAEEYASRLLADGLAKGWLTNL